MCAYVAVIIVAIKDDGEFNLSAIMTGIIAYFISASTPIFYVFYHKNKTSKKMSLRLVNSKHKLSDTLQRYIYYESFMKYLIEEFSMECLLSYTEFTQYNIYSNDKLLNKTVDNTILPLNDIPKSSIVYNQDINESDTATEVRMKAHKLFNKYVRIGATFEINISYLQRKALIDLMNNETEWLSNNDIKHERLCDIFNDSCKTMYKLMNDAHHRFIITESFLRISKGHV